MGEKQLSLQHGETKMAERKNGKLPFPHKLHHMLLESEDLGMSHIISWLPNGKAFKIHNPAAFESTIMKKHFKQTKLKSFTRQLVSTASPHSLITFRLRSSFGFYAFPSIYMVLQKSLPDQMWVGSFTRNLAETTHTQQ